MLNTIIISPTMTSDISHTCQSLLTAARKINAINISLGLGICLICVFQLLNIKKLKNLSAQIENILGQYNNEVGNLQDSLRQSSQKYKSLEEKYNALKNKDAKKGPITIENLCEKAIQEKKDREIIFLKEALAEEKSKNIALLEAQRKNL